MTEYRFPNHPVIPTKPAVFDDTALVRSFRQRLRASLVSMRWQFYWKSWWPLFQYNRDKSYHFGEPYYKAFLIIGPLQLHWYQHDPL